MPGPTQARPIIAVPSGGALASAISSRRIVCSIRPPSLPPNSFGHAKPTQPLARTFSSQLARKFLSRSLNEGFSGGEKKRNEIFQMAMLEPKLAILDETDSGLDIDALRIVANGVNKLKSKDNAVIVITHYQRLLDYIVPDFVHVLYNGKIVKSGGKELAHELEEKGYDWIKQEQEV